MLFYLHGNCCDKSKSLNFIDKFIYFIYMYIDLYTILYKLGQLGRLAKF